MGRWYQAEQGAGSRLWLYSERGLMSYLLCHVLPCELAFVLDNARDQDGVQLRDVVGTPTSHTTLTEFELGNQGFGSPDGGVAITAGDRTSFVFVEAKQREFGASRTDPVLRTPEDLSDPDLDIDKLCRGNTFNSAINGQLELCWRFAGWGGFQWRGFFLALQDRLGEGDWKYVPNASGGFMGFWWHHRGDRYLQLEDDKLCFKVAVPDEAQQTARWLAWHHALMATNGAGGVTVKKTTRRAGRWMTVAALDGDYRQADPGGLLDFDKTVDRLRAVESFMDAALAGV